MPDTCHYAVRRPAVHWAQLDFRLPTVPGIAHESIPHRNLHRPKVASDALWPEPDPAIAPLAKSAPVVALERQLSRSTLMHALDEVFDLDPVHGDQVDSGTSRTGPRFLARIDIDYDETKWAADDLPKGAAAGVR